MPSSLGATKKVSCCASDFVKTNRCVPLFNNLSAKARTASCEEPTKGGIKNNAKESIDIAIYGYSRTPEIENALISASKRGVKIRLVIDSDQKGENIYPDTDIIKKILPDNISDINSAEVQNIMQLCRKGTNNHGVSSVDVSC